MPKKFFIANELPIAIYIVVKRRPGADRDFYISNSPPANKLDAYYKIGYDQYFEFNEPIDTCRIHNNLGRGFSARRITNDEKIVFHLKAFKDGAN